MNNEQLETEATKLRAFLAPRWDAWRAERGRPAAVPSDSMCRFSASFMAKALESITGHEWLVCGGDPDADPEDLVETAIPGCGGICGADGQWRGHYWVVDEHWEWIVDVTADQFGFEQIVVVPADAPRYCGTYNEAAVADHLTFVRDRVEQWLLEAESEGLLKPDFAAVRNG